MKNVQRNIISFFIGCFFIYIFVWLQSLVAAFPVPQIIQSADIFLTPYYSNVILVCLAACCSTILMMIVRRAFTLFTKQNLLCFALPIVLFFSYLLVFLSFAAIPLLYAAIPTLLVAFFLSKGAPSRLTHSV